MGDQVRAKNSNIPTKELCPPQRTSALPGKTYYQYLSELEASRPSAEKVRFDMLKRLNDCRDKYASDEDLVECMAGTEEKRGEILGRGRGGGGKWEVGGPEVGEGQEKEVKGKEKGVECGLGIGDGYKDGWLRVL
ncbi:hypothetical protein LTR17_014714 [Elasticomyces elasticus]|nr:hypothetical protein LTR17_014714 [Elasticomyces elasticus]